MLSRSYLDLSEFERLDDCHDRCRKTQMDPWQLRFCSEGPRSVGIEPRIISWNEGRLNEVIVREGSLAWTRMQACVGVTFVLVNPDPMSESSHSLQRCDRGMLDSCRAARY